MSMSIVFISISLSGIIAAIVYYLRQPKVKQSVSDNTADEAENKQQQPNVLLLDTVILVIFFGLLLVLGTQLS